MRGAVSISLLSGLASLSINISTTPSSGRLCALLSWLGTLAVLSAPLALLLSIILCRIKATLLYFLTSETGLLSASHAMTERPRRMTVGLGIE